MLNYSAIGANPLWDLTAIKLMVGFEVLKDLMFFIFTIIPSG